MRDHDHDSAAALHLLGIVLAGAVIILGLYASGCVRPEPIEPGGTVSCKGAAAVISELGGCGIERACNAGGECRTFLESCEALESDLPGIVNLDCIVAQGSCEGVFACEGGS